MNPAHLALLRKIVESLRVVEVEASIDRLGFVRVSRLPDTVFYFGPVDGKWQGEVTDAALNYSAPIALDPVLLRALPGEQPTVAELVLAIYRKVAHAKICLKCETRIATEGDLCLICHPAKP